jgi:hypothetical protein
MLLPPHHHSPRNFSLWTAVADHLATVVLLLFLCSQLHAVMHHHNDLKEHLDCSICAVAHHQSADSTLPLPYNIPAPITGQLQSFFTVILCAISAPETYPSRAPPA